MSLLQVPVRLPKGRTAKLAVLLGIVATIAQAQVTVTSGSFGALPNGLIASPALFFAVDPTTGWIRNNADTWDFVAAGVRAFNLSATRFGIVAGKSIIFTNSTTDPNTTASLTITSGSTNATGALRILAGTTPTQSGTTCGTAPTISGNNSNGAIALGSAPGLPCQIVFNGNFPTAPHCYLNPEILTTGTTTVRATSLLTTGFVITSSAALVQADKITWWCVGE